MGILPIGIGNMFAQPCPGSDLASIAIPEVLIQGQELGYVIDTLVRRDILQPHSRNIPVAPEALQKVINRPDGSKCQHMIPDFELDLFIVGE